jgi:hypothetical protein
MKQKGSGPMATIDPTKETHPTPDQIAEEEKRKEIESLRSSLPQKPIEQWNQVEINKLIILNAKERGYI